MTASVRDLTKAGATLSAAVDAGGNAVRVDAVSFALEDTNGLVAGARKGAVDDAKAKAEQYAAAAGRSLGAVQSISEVVTSPTPQYMDGIAYARTAALAAPVPLQAGQPGPVGAGDRRLRVVLRPRTTAGRRSGAGASGQPTRPVV